MRDTLERCHERDGGHEREGGVTRAPDRRHLRAQRQTPLGTGCQRRPRAPAAPPPGAGGRRPTASHRHPRRRAPRRRDLPARPRTALLPGVPRGHPPGTSREGAQEAAHRRERDLARLGEALGQAVLPGQVGAELATALARTAAAGETLRLELEAGPALLALPFEAARLPDGRIPALDPGGQLLRRPSGLEAEPLDPLPGPLRILVAVGAPDEAAAGGAVLDYERELQTILDAIDQARRYGNAEVQILEVGHPDQIRRALLQRGCQVLHLSGHGRAGVIELEDEDGRPLPVTPKELTAALRAGARP